ncbi:ABC-type transport system, involved in lipopr otein release, permease component [Peptoclostridium acidaminophilum DSM 3953]|uniref:ABC-type transport system, involved in lipopr otein release, permease component n=1 Tax=Peptoclostridium acidaminophilum DSM 3953 TaxID=1286171 RepID=W8T419_PEPAC|nr:FtsX-like permease family protein [Peptoclostridium acidaminophilum]AHM55565.1 ABC-type transport system, involved in lipopr otein release, permease component [Peptoclostridium acidaminophilum DSM 3953]
MILHKKLLRDIMGHKLVYISCAIVMMVGLSVYTSMFMVMVDLKGALDDFYGSSHFADGFAQVTGIPVNAVDSLGDIEGIERIQGQLVKDVRVYDSESKKVKYIRMVSIESEDPSSLNKPVAMEGEQISPSREGIWTDIKYYKANNISPGDTIEVIAEGKRTKLKVLGGAVSPDYVYAIRGIEQIYPDPLLFGVAFINYSNMEGLFREKGLHNELSFTLKEGYTYDDVESRLKQRLKRYGLKGIYERKDQVSHSILNNEIVQLENTAKTFPFIFISVASFVLYMMLRRIVEQQKGQIGILKAFGYTQKEIFTHYMGYSLLVGVMSGIFGGLLGFWLESYFVEMYMEFFTFPNLRATYPIEYFFQANLIAIAFSLFAGYSGTKRILALTPAQALRTEVEIKTHTIFIEKIKLLWNSLNSLTKMTVRNLFRNKARSFFTMLGMLFVFSIVTTMASFMNTVEIMMDEQFNEVQTFDAKMSFYYPLDASKLHSEIINNENVVEAEPLLEAPVRIKNAWLEKDALCIGIKKGSRLYNILDGKGQRVEIKGEGLILSERLANSLRLKEGDTVELESPWATRDTVRTTVEGIVPQYFGVNAYMELDALCELLGHKAMANSVLMNIKEGSFESLNDDYIEGKNVSSLDRKESVIEMFNSLMESYSYMQWIFVVFGVISGFAVVYTSSTIIFSERERELSSLRVLGMTRNEVFRIIALEQWLIAIGSWIVGIPVAFGLRWIIAQGMSTDLFSIPYKIDTMSFVSGLAVAVASVIAAQVSVYRKISRLDMVEVLKERE